MKRRKHLVERDIQRTGNDIQELRRFLESNKKDIENQILELKGRNELNEKNIQQVEKELEKEKRGQNKRIREIIEEIQEMKLKIQKSEEYFMENRFVNSKAENVKCRASDRRPVDPRKVLREAEPQADAHHRKEHIREPRVSAPNRFGGQAPPPGDTQARRPSNRNRPQVASGLV